ncbi:MAG: modulator of FtsH protease HflC [Verrucomicrobiota bacterium]|jgi:membrane protease subunit HflC|nr:modulator of FtsH protease HflC [Verrucomicrobiota bacterium]MDK2964168.1 modulator of FtsH protease HflC [Verrucomicrobiota bacterium]
MNTLIKQSIAALALILVVAAAAIFSATAYTVDQAEQVVVLQFGKAVGDPVTEPGLHFKMPFIQEIRRYEKRLLVWDGDPNQVPTRGREFISVDATARWRIVDALQFLKSVRDEAGAQSRLDDIIDSVVRDNISSTELTEIVRSRDWELSEKDLERMDVIPAENSNPEELTETIRLGRETLTRNILKEASRGMPEKYGIELVDVRIKRLNYITSVRQQVFQRMISERQRIAEQFRSQGEGEASRIEGDTSRELALIRSEAQRKAEIVRGEADAEATRIYNQAYAADADFYSFLRTLESYPEALNKRSVLILGTGSDYLRFLNNIDPSNALPAPQPGEGE